LRKRGDVNLTRGERVKRDRDLGPKKSVDGQQRGRSRREPNEEPAKKKEALRGQVKDSGRSGMDLKTNKNNEKGEKSDVPQPS